MKTKILQNTKSIILALILTLCVGSVSAYSTYVGPTATAPGNNTDTPINVGSSSQIKTGNLWIKATGLANGLIVENGNVGIGTTAPTAKLQIGGTAGVDGIKFPDGTTQTTASVGLPTGAISAFYLSSCPTGWILANGANGTPDLRGVFIRGLDNGRGIDSGRVLGTYQSDAFKAHSHSIGVSPVELNFQFDGSIHAAQTLATNTGSTGGNETRPVNVALIYCMKQ